MINIIKIPRYLSGTPEVLSDYNSRYHYVYVEVATGHICTILSGGRFQSRMTGMARRKIREKQYLKVTFEDLVRMTKGGYVYVLRPDQYSMYLNHGPLRP